MKSLMRDVLVSSSGSMACAVGPAWLAEDLKRHFQENLTTQVQVDEEAIGNDLEPQAVINVNASVQAVRDAVADWARQREGASPAAGETVDGSDGSATSFVIML